MLDLLLGSLQICLNEFQIIISASVIRLAGELGRSVEPPNAVDTFPEDVRAFGFRSVF